MDRTRALVVFFSRTGTTDIVARAIRDELGCEIEAIRDAHHRTGVFGYLRSGFDAAFHRPAKLRAMISDPNDYDLVVVGTPIWNASVSAPVRTYLLANRERIRRVAFFCTHGASGSARVLHQMEEICGQSPVVTLVLRTEEVRHSGFGPKVRSFVSALKTTTAAAETERRAHAYEVPTLA